MSTDFKGRTVLKIITINMFEELMDGHDPKADNLMLNIWHGSESTKCDGNFFGFSSLGYILQTKTKRVKKSNYSFMKVVTNGY